MSARERNETRMIISQLRRIGGDCPERAGVCYCAERERLRRRLRKLRAKS